MLPPDPAHASFYEATRCQAPGDLQNLRTSFRRSGLLMSKEPAEAAPRSRPRSLHHARRPVCPTGGPCGVELCPTPFYPCSIRGDRSKRSRTSCTHALDRGGKPLHRSNGSRHRKPEAFASGSPPVDARATGARRIRYAFSVAPSGMTPCSATRHSAMASFRARATMPIRVLRPPARPTRLRNHCVNALVGCQRTHPHASCRARRRHSGRPARLIP
jgi:hypothetical protein